MNDSNTLDRFPRLYCLHYKECDPKKCTALKLNRLNLLKIVPTITKKMRKAVILNPFSTDQIDVKDKELIHKHGLVVIDCSWKNIITLNKNSFENERALPPLIAANPVNYGKWEKLSSVEALAAALFLTNFQERAILLLSKFSWGSQFIEINKLGKKKN